MIAYKSLSNPVLWRDRKISAPRATSMKRNRERAKSEKRKEKLFLQEERKKAKEAKILPEDGSDPDLEGIIPGPQEPLY